jgi:hypothetical protein
LRTETAGQGAWHHRLPRQVTSCNLLANTYEERRLVLREIVELKPNTVEIVGVETPKQVMRPERSHPAIMAAYLSSPAQPPPPTLCRLHPAAQVV